LAKVLLQLVQIDKNKVGYNSIGITNLRLDISNMQDRPTVLCPQPSKSEVTRLVEKFSLPLDDQGKPFKFDYGTAGFRYDASLLKSTMIRVGLAAAYRSFVLKEAVGVMITASHNDESFNGVKLADPNGGMMATEGECLAVRLANAITVDDLLSSIPITSHATVHVGRDTRSHSPDFEKLVVQAARAMGATVLVHGVVTTPQLHYCVLMDNPPHLPPLIPPRPYIQGYYEQLAHSYLGLLQGIPDEPNPIPLIVDCACGVGFYHLQRLNDYLQRLGAKRLFLPKNSPSEGPLNENCGSEHVQKYVCAPKWYSKSSTTPHAYNASLDGDADRIVFFSETPNFFLLDGDKISALLCDFLQSQVSVLRQALTEKTDIDFPPLRLGVVQTAYANGASTQYLKKVLGGENVVFAKTGVKYVHEAAHQNFDIGVYFEANGHGTVLFAKGFYDFLLHADRFVRGHRALRCLQLLPALINQAVGDALSDLLLVDAILHIQGKTVYDWNSLYTDLPSRQSKVQVRDRTMIQTNSNETECISPVELQSELQEAMAQFPKSRCFVRPSGTENVVRIYAEALTAYDADALASIAAHLVHKLCQGIGDPPRIPNGKM
jgi:phosphoacetylglucosamine mutase